MGMGIVARGTNQVNRRLEFSAFPSGDVGLGI